MATVFKPVYASVATLTCTLNSLASAGARQSTVVDNTTNLYLDALVAGTFKTAAGTLGVSAVVSLYVYALSDGAAYTDGATGSDAAFTLPTTPNLILLRQVSVNTAAVAVACSPASIALAFGGTLPLKWGIVVVNSTGLALDVSAGGTLSFIGINAQGV